MYSFLFFWFYSDHLYKVLIHVRKNPSFLLLDLQKSHIPDHRKSRERIPLSDYFQHGYILVQQQSYRYLAFLYVVEYE